MPNVMKMVFSTTTTTVISHTSDITSTNVAGGTATLDNSVELYPYAVATLTLGQVFGTAPTNNSAVNLYAVLQETDGGSNHDTAVPSSADVQSARFVGAFPIYDENTAIQRATINISLDGIRKAKFYIQNMTGQTIDCTPTATTVKITPYTYAPA